MSSASDELDFIAGGETPGAELKRAVRDAALATLRREAGHANRSLVLVTSYRTRLLDPDNLCPKYFVDSLRYAGIIPEDDANSIIIFTTQERVKKREDERTEIEITKL